MSAMMLVRKEQTSQDQLVKEFNQEAGLKIKAKIKAEIIIRTEEDLKKIHLQSRIVNFL